MLQKVTKSVSMINELCVVGKTPVDLNPDKIYQYPLTISINRCDGYYNSVNLGRGRIISASHSPLLVFL